MPPPKLWVFSRATAAVETRYGPASGEMMPAIVDSAGRPAMSAAIAPASSRPVLVLADQIPVEFLRVQFLLLEFGANSDAVRPA